MARLPLLAALLLAASLPARITAYRRYLNYAPNSASVPCPRMDDGKPAEGCHGASICEAWGHVECLAKGSGEDDDIATPAGSALDAAIESGGWNVETCEADSDGDGKTDGDELGDGCCAWSYRQAPMTTTGISNPSYASSVTSRPSCTLAGAPPAPAPVTVSANGQGGVSITWAANTPATVCVCEYKVVVQVGSAAAVTYGTRERPLHLCGLTPGAAVTVTVYALNRAGSSPAAGPVVGTVGAAGASACLGATARGLAAPTVGSPMYMNTAGTQGTVPDPPMAYAGVIPFVVLGALFAVSGLIVLYVPDPQSWVREKLVHKYVWLRKDAATGKAGMGGKLLHLLASPFMDLGEASVGYTLSLVALLIAIVASAGATAAYYNWMIFPLGTQAAVGRGTGYALAASMGLQLLPAARYSLFLPIFGVSFERALKFHRWAGVSTVILALLHALLMFLAYAPTQLGWQFCLLWLPKDAVNPLAGFLSGLFILILTVLAWNPIRRRFYELFLVGHMLWPLAFLFAWLHIKESDTGVNPVFIPPVVLCVLDFALLALDLGWLRETVLIDAGLVYTDGRVVSLGSLGRLDQARAGQGQGAAQAEPIVSFLVMDKLPAAFGWAFTYHPGQFVYISLPRVSLWPHPISISSPCDPAHPGRFTVHVRSMGKGTWSGAVADAVQAAMAAKGAGGGAVAALGAAVGIPVGTAAGDGGTVVSRTNPRAAMHGDPAAAAPVLGSAESELAPVHLAVPDWGRSLPPTASALSSFDLATLPVPKAMRGRLTVTAAGPFGLPSVQLARYKHFFLVAGGIGVTPIAPLHYSLLHGLSVGHPSGAVGAAWEAVAALARCGKAKTGLSHADDVASVLSVTTLWSVREAGLISAFVPLLEDKAVAGPADPAGAVAPAASAPATPVVNLGVYYTAAKPKGEGAAPPPGPSFPWPTRSGRPDYRAMMRQAADAAAVAEAASPPGASHGRATSDHIAVAVVVCGPQPMVESVLAAAADTTGYVPANTGRPVHFHVHRETFMM